MRLRNGSLKFWLQRVWIKTVFSGFDGTHIWRSFKLANFQWSRGILVLLNVKSPRTDPEDTDLVPQKTSMVSLESSMDFSQTTNSRTSQNTIEPCLLKLDLQNTIMDLNIWKRDTDGNLWKLKDGSKRSLELGSTFDTESRFGIPRGTQISKLGFLETFQTLQNPILSLALKRQPILLKVRELDKF